MYDATAARATALDWTRRQRGPATAAYLYTREAGDETLLGQLATGWNYGTGENDAALLTVSQDAVMSDDDTLTWAQWDTVTHIGVVFADGRPSKLFRVPEGGKRPPELGNQRVWRFDLAYVGPFTVPVADVALLLEAGTELLTEAGDVLELEAA
jgi:hypothetical protein